MTVLVAYATHSGATRTLAETLQDALRAEGLETDLVDLEESPDPAGYEAVVLGSGVRIEAVEKTAMSWARAHEGELAGRPFAFFSCSGSAAPVAVRNFPGWVLMDRLPLRERVLMTSMRTPTGDFRDLPAVTTWGREIAPLLRG